MVKTNFKCHIYRVLLQNAQQCIPFNFSDLGQSKFYFFSLNSSLLYHLATVFTSNEMNVRQNMGEQNARIRTIIIMSSFNFE